MLLPEVPLVLLGVLVELPLLEDPLLLLGFVELVSLSVVEVADLR